MKGIVLSSLLAIAPSVLGLGSHSSDLALTAVTGYFLQDDPSTISDGFDYANWNFGLLNRTYDTDQAYDPHGKKTQWQRFAHFIDHLNKGSKKHDPAYKMLFMGRHGEGYHNVAESYYGTPAWNCYWAEKDGNGTITWADPLLTPAGTAQAVKANAYYKSRFEEQGLPYFQSYYSSPLKRCLQTANTTFATGLNLPHHHGFKPTIKEKFREGISIHTCDHRSDKKVIRDMFPGAVFEKGFSEVDPLWRGKEGEGETKAHQAQRSIEVLRDVFAHDDATWISISSHSGEIAALLAVLGHRQFSLSTGQIIPVLVKGEKKRRGGGGDPLPSLTSATGPGFTPEATCNEPPVTSVSGTGCVCSQTSTP